MYILGISALYHDSAAAIIEDGVIVAAAQEERFTRIKHDKSIPFCAIEYCLSEAHITSAELDAVVYYDDPILTLERYLSNVSAAGDDYEDLFNLNYDNIFRNKLWIEKSISSYMGGLGKHGKLLYAKHHLSHGASAFYPSPFRSAAIITIDGVGEWNTTTIGYGDGSTIKVLRRIDYPHSLGLLYSAFTYFCGFKVNSGDYKLMGLAPYGEPVYVELIKKEIIDIKSDGSYRLNLKYFDFQFGRTMTNERFAALFGGERRKQEEKITKREMDMAASIQKIIEEIVVKLAKTAKLLTDGAENLCLAGGVALNCVANGILAKKKIFKNIWIQPAAGDAGGALGCAFLAYYDYFKSIRNVDGLHDLQKGSYLGPEFSEKDIQVFLSKKHLPYTKYKNKNDEFYDTIAELLDNQKIIGLFNGRMEFGPRALGNRSIIADPRSENMQAKLNISIKHRESFRPFAPTVMKEREMEYFITYQDSPYMLICGEVKEKKDLEFNVHGILEDNENMLSIINRKRSIIPAVTHIDYSARIQTIEEKQNPNYYKIIKAFAKKTGCGVVINTSFNVRGEPIVCTPEDAYHCFMNTDMDILVLNNFILYKEQQPEAEKRNDIYEPD